MRLRPPELGFESRAGEFSLPARSERVGMRRRFLSKAVLAGTTALAAVSIALAFVVVGELDRDSSGLPSNSAVSGSTDAGGLPAGAPAMSEARALASAPALILPRPPEAPAPPGPVVPAVPVPETTVAGKPVPAVTSSPAKTDIVVALPPAVPDAGISEIPRPAQSAAGSPSVSRQPAAAAPSPIGPVARSPADTIVSVPTVPASRPRRQTSEALRTETTKSSLGRTERSARKPAIRSETTGSVRSSAKAAPRKPVRAAPPEPEPVPFSLPGALRPGSS